ncbi:MAG: glycosyltransferase family 2 protein, partial [Microbacteriaceae bacterium]
MRLSVVIPVRNDAAMLATALESLGAQHRPPDEIVVVDNGSSDQSAEVALAAGARVVPQPVRGIPSAASTGYDAAT